MRAPLAFPVCVIALFLSGSVSAQPVACQLCAPSEARNDAARPRAPLQIEVEAALDFSRVARIGGEGSVSVDPANGARSVSGGLVDLGGGGLSGSARVSGEPFAPVLVTLPHRIELRSTAGDVAEVVDIKSDLRGTAQLDGAGQLRFSFGGRLIVRGNGGGVFRGNIPISVDYP